MKARSSLIGLTTALSILAASPSWIEGAGLPTDDPCEVQRQWGYNQGFNEGRTAGYSEGQTAGYDEGYAAGLSEGQTIGYDEGLAEGTAEGIAEAIAECRADPLSCGIALGSCLAPAQFGETEPNDNIVTADTLITDTNFLGQSMSPDDEDWYYIVTERANQNLTVNFSVPRPDGVTDLTGWGLTGWEVTIRDARGNRLAGFTTDFLNVDDPAAGFSYRVTLGLVGTYYLVIQPTDNNLSFHPYNIATFLQDTSLDVPQIIAGYFDAEIEHNDWPSEANRIANGVTLYGLINLTFDQTLPGGESGYSWAQGEDDWYRYTTAGDELVTLTFCGRESCGDGNWFVEVYDEEGANALEQGAPESSVTPLLAINTGFGAGETEEGDAPDTVHFGLMAPGDYYMRINHKRKFEAPCVAYAQDRDKNGLVDPEMPPCGCDSGDSCDITIPNPNPSGLCPDGSGEITIDEETQQASGPQQCDVTCRCNQRGLVVEVPQGEVTSPYNFTWLGTDLSPATITTDAYLQEFLSRPSPLGD